MNFILIRVRVFLSSEEVDEHSRDETKWPPFCIQKVNLTICLYVGTLFGKVILNIPVINDTHIYKISLYVNW